MPGALNHARQPTTWSRECAAACNATPGYPHCSTRPPTTVLPTNCAHSHTTPALHRVTAAEQPTWGHVHCRSRFQHHTTCVPCSANQTTPRAPSRAYSSGTCCAIVLGSFLRDFLYPGGLDRRGSSSGSETCWWAPPSALHACGGKLARTTSTTLAAL